MTAFRLARLLFPALLLGTAPSHGAEVPDYGQYASLLTQYGAADGVRYAAWHKNEQDLKALEQVLADFSKIDYTQLNPPEATAFLVNLYNAAMIRAVLEHYPIESVRSIGFLPFSIFRRDIVSLNGEKVSLDHIEKRILLEEFDDPRIHFAVNCASVSCPPLRLEPFTGRALEIQFDEQARLFANSPHAARVVENKKATEYSELFNWYDADFPGDDPATYLNQFRDSPLPVGNKVLWIEYDWGLNES